MRMWFATLFLTLPLLVQGETSSLRWTEIRRADGVVVYQAQVPGSPLLAFKATGTIDAEMAKVATILMEQEKRVRWIPDVETSAVLRRPASNEVVEYFVFRTVPFVAQRDFVVKGRVNYDAKSQQIHLDFKSVEDTLAPATQGIRGQILEGSYVLSPLNEGRSTAIEIVAHVDPKGALPAWLVNLFLRSHPLEEIRAMRRYLTQHEVHPHQLVARLKK